VIRRPLCRFSITKALLVVNYYSIELAIRHLPKSGCVRPTEYINKSAPRADRTVWAMTSNYLIKILGLLIGKVNECRVSEDISIIDI
jgi:hypothetical protein